MKRATALPPAPRAESDFVAMILGLAPQALCCRPLRGLDLIVYVVARDRRLDLIVYVVARDRGLDLIVYVVARDRRLDLILYVAARDRGLDLIVYVVGIAGSI